MTVDSVLEYFTKIEEKLNNSVLVKSAKKDLLESLTKSSLSNEKRTLLVQQFSEQIAINFVGMALDKAIQIDSVIADINLKNAQKGLVDEQKKTETQQTQNVIAEKELKNSQKAKNTADTALVYEQKGLVTKQKETEAKRAINITSDSNLKNAQKDLINEQKKTETKQQLLLSVQKWEKIASAKKQLGAIITETSFSDVGGGLIDKQIKGFSKDSDYKILKSCSEQAGMLAQNDVATPSWMTTEMKNAISRMKNWS